MNMKTCIGCAYKPKCTGKEPCRQYVNKESLHQFKSFIWNTEEGKEFEKGNHNHSPNKRNS